MEKVTSPHEKVWEGYVLEEVDFFQRYSTIYLTFLAVSGVNDASDHKSVP
jgi:hypothetical protein